jgi:hypothetical protein
MRIAQWAIVLALALTVSAYGQTAGAGEHVATLYGNDGTTLYRINPNNGQLEVVGTYQTQDRMRFTISNLVYDASKQRFAALATFPDLVSAPPNPAQVQRVWVDPATAEPSGFTDYTIRDGSALLTYDAANRQLYAYNLANLSSGASAFLMPLDPPGPGGIETINCGVLFFDPRGNLWSFTDGTADGSALFRESTLSGKSLFERDGRIPFEGSVGTMPLYGSFSFQPYTGQLFATFGVPEDSTGAPLPWEQDTGEAKHFVGLCTVDLKTGAPKRVITTYDTKDWFFQIAWAP